MKLICCFLLATLIIIVIFGNCGQPKDSMALNKNINQPELQKLPQSFKETEKIIEFQENIKGFDIMTDFLEKFVVNSDKDFSKLIDAQFQKHSFYSSEKILSDFPFLTQKLDLFFSEQKGCDWFYVFKKEKPYEGFFFYRSKTLGINNIMWEAKFSAFCFIDEQWFRILIEGNLFPRDGYVWVRDPKVIIRPRQILKAYTGECIYMFGLSYPPSSQQLPLYIIPGELTN